MVCWNCGSREVLKTVGRSHTAAAPIRLWWLLFILHQWKNSLFGVFLYLRDWKLFYNFRIDGESSDELPDVQNEEWRY